MDERLERIEIGLTALLDWARQLSAAIEGTAENMPGMMRMMAPQIAGKVDAAAAVQAPPSFADIVNGTYRP